MSLERGYDIISIPSTNYEAGTVLHPEFLIIHCVGLPLEDVIQGFTMLPNVHPKGLGVSAHYFIPQLTGYDLQQQKIIDDSHALTHPDHVPVIQFVPETNQAWHAGESYWGGHRDLNRSSLGIEFHAPGYGSQNNWFHFTPYSASQLQTGEQLIQDICRRWNIPAKAILAHSDIAPYRANSPTFKTDPGPLFPWKQWSEKGIGYYPEWKTLVSITEKGHLQKQQYVRQRLQEIGYRMPPASETWGLHDRLVVNAYRMHYMQDHYQPVNPDDPTFGCINDDLLMCLHGHQLL